MGGRLEGRSGARGVVTGEGEAHIFVVSTARAVWQGHNSVSNLTTHAACCGVNEDSEVFSTDWSFRGGQDECRFGDGADSLRAQSDAVERPPAGLEQRDPAFAWGA